MNETAPSRARACQIVRVENAAPAGASTRRSRHSAWPSVIDCQKPASMQVASIVSCFLSGFASSVMRSAVCGRSPSARSAGFRLRASFFCTPAWRTVASASRSARSRVSGSSRPHGRARSQAIATARFSRRSARRTPVSSGPISGEPRRVAIAATRAARDDLRVVGRERAIGLIGDVTRVNRGDVPRGFGQRVAREVDVSALRERGGRVVGVEPQPFRREIAVVRRGQREQRRRPEFGQHVELAHANGNRHSTAHTRRARP